MPIINIPEIGQVRFPDEMSDEDIVKAIKNNILKQPAKELGVGDYLKDIPKALGRGAVGLLETSGIGASALLPEEYEKQARAGIEGLAKPAKEYLAPATPELGESIPSKLASGLGSTLPFFAAGPLGLAGRVAAGALGVSAGAGEARQSAEQAGATKEERGTATLLGAPTGLLDILAPEIGPLKTLFGTALARGGVEGLTEASQKVAQNLIARGIYNPKQDVLEGSGEEGAYGAGIGALASLLVDLTLGRKAKGAGAQPPPQAPAVPMQAPAVQPVAPQETGFTAEQAQGLRQDAELAEQARQSGIAEADRAIQAQMAAVQEQQMQTAQELARAQPEFSGAPNANTDMMGAVRQRQEEARAAEEQQLAAEQTRQQQEHEAQIQQIQNTVYSADPVQNQIVQNRLLGNIAKPEEVVTLPPTQSNPPEEIQSFYAPREALGKPRGASEQKFSLDEKQEIADRRSDLAAINKDLAQATKGKSNLFNFLKGKLVDRPGAFSLSDIDKDNAKLKKLYNEQGRGVLLEDIVANGTLDSFLPPEKRVIINGEQNPRFDGNEAIEIIASKLRSGDYTDENTSAAVAGLTGQKDQIKREIERLSAIPDVNLELSGILPSEYEPISTEDLEKDASNLGLDLDSIRENVYYSKPDATQEQYNNSYRNAIESAVRQRTAISETLQSQDASGGNSPTKEGYAVQQELQGRDFNQVVQWHIDNAPNKFQKLLGEKTQAMIRALQARGVNMSFELASGGTRSSSLSGANGVTNFLWDPVKGTSIKVALNGEPVMNNQMGYPSGMDYGTVQHELLHVATRTATKFLPKDHPVIKELNDLYKTVIKQFNADAKAGTLPPVLQKFYKRHNNVLSTVDEMISWGMTDRDFQNYLSKIKVGPQQNAFSKLVSLIREVLGISKPFQTAMEKLVHTTDSLLSMDADVVGREMQNQGYSYGKPQKKVGPMTQQSLFRGSERIQRDDLAVRKNGFYFNAKESPLYQNRTAEEVGDFSQAEADKIVSLDKRAREIQAEKRWVGKLKDGSWVGTRLDLAVYKAAKKQGLPPVLTIQEGKPSLHEKSGFSRGELLKLVPHVTLRNVRFNVSQTEREKIAGNVADKSRMASADGQYVDAPPNFNGIEVSFNPMREHLFRDSLGRAVKYADEMTAIKNRMFVRGNIEYYGAEDVPPLAVQPSQSWVMGTGQDARQTGRAIIDEPSGNVSKGQQESLFRQHDVMEDTLALRKEGFYIRAEDSPLYQKRNEADVPVVTQQQVDQALQTHAKGARVEGKGIVLKPGDYVGTRLDLPIRNSSRSVIPGGVPVQALHMGNASNYNRENGGFFNGKIAKYVPSITLQNVKFRIDQVEREEIAAGRKKAPMGSVDGQYVRTDNPNFDGVELRFNPKREHLFVDALGRAIKAADEVTAMGDRVYARGNIEYYGAEDFAHPAGPSPTRAMPLSEQDALRQISRKTGSLPMPIQESLFSLNNINDQYEPSLPVEKGPIRETLAQAAAPTRTATGNDAMEVMAGIGRFVKEPEPGYIAKARESWDNARDNPQLTKEQALGSFRRFADKIETRVFSSDAALNNQIRREVMNSTVSQQVKIGMLLNTSLSQTAHSDAIANLFLMKGNIQWDNELHKWTGVDDVNNIITLSRQLDEIADKHGLSKEEIGLIAHTAFEAKRTESLIRKNQQIDNEVAAMREEAASIRGQSPVAASELADKAAKRLQQKIQLQFEGEELAQFIKAGQTQFKLFPELRDVVKTWDGMRSNAINVMVDTGLYSPKEAEELLSNADYVPFFREDQIEEGKGPKEFLRSLSVQADKRIKGSKKPVNDIFDNMVRWTQYAINRGVRNRSALALVSAAEEMNLGRQVKDAKDGENVVRVWKNVPLTTVDPTTKEAKPVLDENGNQILINKQVLYSMNDPLFMSAFRGLESVAIPTVKFFSKFADVLRQSVVLYPLFSVAQVPQDAFAAMFTSGLKPQYALTIPMRAVKEFIQTLRGKSSIHEELKNVGAVGVRDFTSSIIRTEAEILSGLKKDPSLWNSVKRKLGNLAMAADNAVRQATYEAALAQGLSRAEAIEKAFEIFNVRRRGNSQMLAMAGQVIPFFNAYLSAQHVAYRTITGVGTSPTERKAAFETLAATTGSVMAMSMIYAMMMADDEGYEKKPTPTRDRLLIIPGTNGVSIPLRSDIFAMPKIFAEHMYHMITENGMTDAGKFRASMKSVLANSIFSPTPVPQAIKPLAEAIMNYDFFQQKPLVGIFQHQKELSRQFEDSTSEFSKLIGKSEMISPIVADHLIRGMLGSFGGLFLYATNPMLAAMAGTTRPSISMQDALATIPNASGFVSKEYEVGLRKDFYALKEVTDRAAMTMSDLKNRSPQEIGDYLQDDKVRQRLALSPVVNRISGQLTQIRKQIGLLTNVESDSLGSADKEEKIKQLRNAEYQLLKNVNLRKLREMAQV